MGSSDDERISPLERVKGFIKDVWLDSDFDVSQSFMPPKTIQCYFQ